AATLSPVSSTSNVSLWFGKIPELALLKSCTTEVVIAYRYSASMLHLQSDLCLLRMRGRRGPPIARPCVGPCDRLPSHRHLSHPVRHNVSLLVDRGGKRRREVASSR